MADLLNAGLACLKDAISKIRIFAPDEAIIAQGRHPANGLPDGKPWLKGEIETEARPCSIFSALLQSRRPPPGRRSAEDVPASLPAFQQRGACWGKVRLPDDLVRLVKPHCELLINLLIFV